MELKPLHVKVAEALIAEALGWDKTYLDSLEDSANLPALRYDTDWSATGPLIEKYGIALQPEFFMTEPPKLTGYRATHALTAIVGYGATAPEAVCHLILALAEAGKLKAA